MIILEEIKNYIIFKLTKSKEESFLENFIKEFPKGTKNIEDLMIEKNIVESSEGLNFPKFIMHSDPDSTKKYLVIHTGQYLFRPDNDTELHKYLNELPSTPYRKAIDLEKLSNDFLSKYPK